MPRDYTDLHTKVSVRMNSPSRSFWDPIQMNNSKNTKSSKGGKGKSAAPKRKQVQRAPRAQNNSNYNSSQINGRGKQQSVAAAYFLQSGTSKPQFKSLAGGDARIRVKHNEYFADMPGSSNFSVTSYPINPGMKNMFPWLATIAANYETYRFNYLRVHYKTALGTDAVGTLAMSIDYDAADAPPKDLMEAFQNNGTIDSAVWALDSCMVAAKENLDKVKQRYVREKSLAPNQDIKTYDVGNLLMITQGSSNGLALGRLWVEYDVELMTPQGRASSLFAAHVTGSPAPSNTAPFGTAPIFGVNSNSPFTIGPLGQSIAFNEEGGWLITIRVTGVSVVVPTTNPLGTQASVLLLSSLINGGATNGMFTFKVDTDDADSLQFDFTGSAAITAFQLWIGEYDYSIV